MINVVIKKTLLVSNKYCDYDTKPIPWAMQSKTEQVTSYCPNIIVLNGESPHNSLGGAVNGFYTTELVNNLTPPGHSILIPILEL